jgi:cytochrome c-type biogenesis protein
MFDVSVSYYTAFGGGLLSFLTPCVLPLVPVYFTIISGLSLDDLTTAETVDIRKKVFFSTLAFVFGFSVVFVLLGASASYLGGFIGEHRGVLKTAGGIIIIFLGAHLTGVIRIPGLVFEKRAHLKQKPLHLAGAFIAGIAFGAGWTPCIGPILGSIIILAGNQESVREGILLLSVFSAGLALPFIVLSVFINFLLVFIKKATRIVRYINPLAGVLLIVVGVYLIFLY